MPDPLDYAPPPPRRRTPWWPILGLPPALMSLGAVLLVWDWIEMTRAHRQPAVVRLVGGPAGPGVAGPLLLATLGLACGLLSVLRGHRRDGLIVAVLAAIALIGLLLELRIG